jgi:hypothetical protein
VLEDKFTMLIEVAEGVVVRDNDLDATIKNYERHCLSIKKIEHEERGKANWFSNLQVLSNEIHAWTHC